MGLANEQRRTEQLWWTRDLIEDLIVEKSPDFLEYHKNIDEVICIFMLIWRQMW